MESCLAKKDLVLSQLSAGLIPKKGSGGRRWGLGSEHRSPKITECGSEMGDQAVRALLVATQRGLLAAWCEAPRGRGFPWLSLGLYCPWQVNASSSTQAVCMGNEWREGFMQRAGWSRRAGLKLTAPAEKTSLSYSYLWMALRRTCGVQGPCLAARAVVSLG